MKFLFIILIIISFSVSVIPAFSQSPTISKLENKFDVTQNCSNGWNVSGYYLPLESDYTSTIIPVTIDTKIYNFKSDFVEEVKIQGWGKTFSGEYLGFYDGAFHLSKTPLDSLGNNLIVGSIATDPQSIQLGTKVTILTLPSPWNEMIFSANDTSSLITGKEIVVYTGDGLNAKNETLKITSNNNSVCLVNESIPVNQISNQDEQAIPNWIKNNAKWWSSNQIDDKTFLSGIEYLVKTGIISTSDEIAESILENNNSNESDWQTSGPFQINKSKYSIGEKVFLVANSLNPNEKGEIAFMRPSNSTDSMVYVTVPFDGSTKSVFNYYIDPELSKEKGICSINDIIGKWELIFRGTHYPNISFEITKNILPGTNVDSIC